MNNNAEEIFPKFKLCYLTETENIKQSFIMKVTNEIIKLLQSLRSTSQLPYLQEDKGQ